MQIDLSHIPLADNHCHGIYHMQGPMDAPAWRRLFTESSDPGMRSEHVATTLFYHRLVRKMATFFGCDPTEDAVLEARRQFDDRGLPVSCYEPRISKFFSSIKAILNKNWCCPMPSSLAWPVVGWHPCCVWNSSCSA